MLDMMEKQIEDAQAELDAEKEKENKKTDEIAAARVEVVKALLHYLDLTGSVDASNFDEEDIAELADEIADVEEEIEKLFSTMPSFFDFMNRPFKITMKTSDKKPEAKKQTVKKNKKNLTDSEIDNIIDTFLKGIGV